MSKSIQEIMYITRPETILRVLVFAKITVSGLACDTSM